MKIACCFAFVLMLGTLGLAQETGSMPEQKAQEQSAGEDRPKTILDSINVTWLDEQKDFLTLADEMPEDKWNFKPTQGEFKGVRTFAEMVKHVACANEGFAREMHGAAPPEGCEKGGPNPARTKFQIMQYLNDSFQMLNDEFNTIDEKTALQPVDGPYGGPNTRIGIALLATWHVADHYGQLVEYVRMNGIVPPASRPAPMPGK